MVKGSENNGKLGGAQTDPLRSGIGPSETKLHKIAGISAAIPSWVVAQLTEKERQEFCNAATD